MTLDPPLSALEIRDVVKGLILGGRDTTGVTIMWMFYEIGRRPDVEAKMKDEVKDLPTHDTEEFYKALKQCRYCDAVVRETIRHRTPVPLDSRKALNEDLLPDGTFIPQNCIVVFSPYSQGQDTDIWGADADKWRPERWLEPPLSTTPAPDWEYSMFLAGPRICLGKDLALLEAKCCVALLMKAGVTMRLWPGAEEPKHKMGMVLAVDETKGMPMKVTFDDREDEK